MSKMCDLVIDLQYEISCGNMSYREIAEKYSVPLSWVFEAESMLLDEEDIRNSRYEPQT